MCLAMKPVAPVTSTVFGSPEAERENLGIAPASLETVETIADLYPVPRELRYCFRAPNAPNAVGYVNTPPTSS